MPEQPNNKPSPNWVVVLCISLASWLVLVPLANKILIPIETKKTEIISLATTLQISPYSDYIKYLLLVLTPSLIASIASLPPRFGDFLK